MLALNGGPHLPIGIGMNHIRGGSRLHFMREFRRKSLFLPYDRRCCTALKDGSRRGGTCNSSSRNILESRHPCPGRGNMVLPGGRGSRCIWRGGKSTTLGRCSRGKQCQILLAVGQFRIGEALDPSGEAAHHICVGACWSENPSEPRGNIRLIRWISGSNRFIHWHQSLPTGRAAEHAACFAGRGGCSNLPLYPSASLVESFFECR